MTWFRNSRPKTDSTHQKAEADEDSIGKILVELQYITSDELQEAVKVKRARTPFIGDILLEITTRRSDGDPLTREQLAEAVLLQRVRKGVATDREITIAYRKRKTRLCQAITKSSGEAQTALAMLTDAAELVNGT